MPAVRDDAADYDEFAALEGHAEWAGLAWAGPPDVRRCSVEVAAGRRVSMLRWGLGEPSVVMLHGAGQNAHTWDTFAMAYGRPAIAIDLPGHGHSDWRTDRDYTPATHADAVAAVIDEVAPHARVVVGMSLGGLVAITLAARRPDLVRQLVLIDVTPGVHTRVATMSEHERASLMSGATEYLTFEDMVDAVAATMPHRSAESLRPSVRHNARQTEVGGWMWRYDRLDRSDGALPFELEALWDDVSAFSGPITLVQGTRSTHVHEDDVDELRRRAQQVRVERLEAGHGVQSERPVELASLIEELLA